MMMAGILLVDATQHGPQGLVRGQEGSGLGKNDAIGQAEK
jgi:hypothetical protein